MYRGEVVKTLFRTETIYKLRCTQIFQVLKTLDNYLTELKGNYTMVVWF